VDDVTLPGTLHLAILRSPIGHARIESIDTWSAGRLPGVEAVLTGESLHGIAPALPTVTGMPMVRCPEHHPLALGTVRFEGEGVAAVLAADRATAEDALERIEVGYAELPAVTDPLRALQPGAPILHESFGTNLSFEVAMGSDRSEALRQAEVVVSQRMQSQRIVPSPMETRGVVAHREPRDERLIVHLSTQAPHLMRSQIAGYLGLSEHRVRVVAPDVGGAFGAKNNPYAEEMLAAALALRLGRPVKWIEDRLENMVATSHGRGQLAEVEATATRDGRITSLHLRLVLDIGAYHHVLTPMGPFQTAMLMTGCYRIPCASVEILGAFTNKTPIDPYRGFGRAEAAYYVERTMDLVARRLDLDPVEIRRRNFVPPTPSPTPLPWATSTRRATTRPAWTAPSPPPTTAGFANGSAGCGARAGTSESASPPIPGAAASLRRRWPPAWTSSREAGSAPRSGSSPPET
jgi:carbon-monoxide dehydrogenase large subunit